MAELVNFFGDAKREDVAQTLRFDFNFSVIPIALGTKCPPQGCEWEEYQRHLPPAKQLENWINAYEDCNWAVVCGKVSDLVVFDCDDQNALIWASEHLVHTPFVVRTGKGWHLYYRYPEGQKVDSVNLRHTDLKLEAEIKSDGVYVVAPQSVHKNGSIYTAVLEYGGYSWECVPEFGYVKSIDELKQIKPEGKDIRQDLSAGYEITKGERDDTLCSIVGFIIADLVNSGKSVDEIQQEVLQEAYNINSEHCKPPLSRKQVAKIVNSIVRKEKKNYPNGRENKNSAYAQFVANQKAKSEDKGTAAVAFQDIPELKMLHPDCVSMINDVAATSSTGVSVSFGGLIALISYILGGRVKSNLFRSSEVSMNTYSVIEAKSGNAKSAIQKFYFKEPFALLKADLDKFKDDMKEYREKTEHYKFMTESQKEKEPLPPKPKKLYTDLIKGNSTLEGYIRRCEENFYGIAIIVDELKQLTSGFDAYSKKQDGQSKSFLLSAYDGDIYANARKDEENESGASTCLATIFGNVVPEDLVSIYTLSDLFTGFLGRFFFIPYMRTEAKKANTKDFDQTSKDVRDTIYKYCRIDIAKHMPVPERKKDSPSPYIVGFEEDARDLFVEKYNAEHDKAFYLGQEIGPIDKLSVQMEKIITIIHIINCALNGIEIVGPITKKEVEDCLPLWDWLYGNFISVVKRLYAKSAGKDIVQLNEKDRIVLGAILRNFQLPKNAQARYITAKEVAPFIQSEGNIISNQSIALTLRKIMKSSEIIAAKSKGHGSCQYKLTHTSLDRLRGLSLAVESE